MMRVAYFSFGTQFTSFRLSFFFFLFFFVCVGVIRCHGALIIFVRSVITVFLCSFCCTSDIFPKNAFPVLILSFLFLKDEKVQSVLGHFQKYFEGGVSAENLGEYSRIGTLYDKEEV